MVEKAASMPEELPEALKDVGVKMPYNITHMNRTMTPIEPSTPVWSASETLAIGILTLAIIISCSIFYGIYYMRRKIYNIPQAMVRYQKQNSKQGTIKKLREEDDIEVDIFKYGYIQPFPKPSSCNLLLENMLFPPMGSHEEYDPEDSEEGDIFKYGYVKEFQEPSGSCARLKKNYLLFSRKGFRTQDEDSMNWDVENQTNAIKHINEAMEICQLKEEYKTMLGYLTKDNM